MDPDKRSPVILLVVAIVVIIGAAVWLIAGGLDKNTSQRPKPVMPILDIPTIMVTPSSTYISTNTATSYKPTKRERNISRSLGRLPIIHTSYEKRVKPSTYLGKWYRPHAERNRRCIVWRESNAILHVRNGGLYQFERATSDHVARLINRPDLVGTSATYWSRKDQDRGFWRLWQGRKGAFHWQGGNWNCLQKARLP